MPLANGYGVLIGTLHDYYRDPRMTSGATTTATW